MIWISFLKQIVKTKTFRIIKVLLETKLKSTLQKKNDNNTTKKMLFIKI